uniref:Uncharacterized protein n=1 Tax=Trieres chinensis TaxID=1514140 RepID=A0A7S2A9P4_TRICV|mmetsp:Transcript_8588/g.18156  ORF Transcript_8588/g.18156 Transcript_8588/m.18156 type:complete len:159 (+) Transcript_8588:123-599(+)|eukprot:CAMPEP_0183308350 /NCGR_PEP_ID=MMETSP0160_2-20130417/21462_1 /TAXON_ID=2839 ORGANISM="Odontella Sinensis, Strain Grunow 1884" /NCGR_SAMPLE_ID=MMETSP0160_2 /ASSEMBLY_ACC=CAM_ASM_000250 /LENGTH=158 /DNA_ID=CAMNT_0025472173 /DNA_START=87 /DNA_END=563 /DNA_ORIENTATION=+
MLRFLTRTSHRFLSSNVAAVSKTAGYWDSRSMCPRLADLASSRPSSLIAPPRSSIAKPRPFSSGATLSDDDLRSRLEDFQEQFAEARLCIEDCADAADTTYFDEEADAAREAVDLALKTFESILAELDEETKGRVVRQNGLKVEQLKGELELVLNGGH